MLLPKRPIDHIQGSQIQGFRIPEIPIGFIRFGQVFQANRFGRKFGGIGVNFLFQTRQAHGTNFVILLKRMFLADQHFFGRTALGVHDIPISQNRCRSQQQTQ